MYEAARFSRIARGLQSECATRCIEYRNGDFYCGDDEVTGRRYIPDLMRLNWGWAKREEHKIVELRLGKALDCFPAPDLASLNDHIKRSSEGSVSDHADLSAEQVVVLLLEDYETGSVANFVANSPDARAAIGRLCNLFIRENRRVPVIKLTTWTYRDKPHQRIKAPDLRVERWEPSFRPSEDDIPF